MSNCENSDFRVASVNEKRLVSQLPPTSLPPWTTTYSSSTYNSNLHHHHHHSQLHRIRPNTNTVTTNNNLYHHQQGQIISPGPTHVITTAVPRSHFPTSLIFLSRLLSSLVCCPLSSAVLSRPQFEMLLGSLGPDGIRKVCCCRATYPSLDKIHFPEYLSLVACPVLKWKKGGRLERVLLLDPHPLCSRAKRRSSFHISFACLTYTPRTEMCSAWYQATTFFISFPREFFRH